jgi:hypothetical protein
MLLGTVAAALACAASEGLEWNAKALQLYRAAHYAEAEAMCRQALDTFHRNGDPRLVRAEVNYARLQEETLRLAQPKKVKAKTLR